MRVFLRVTEKVNCDCIAVAFDVRQPTFRHKASAAYKATRKGMPEELAMQMPILKNLLAVMGITTLEKAGYEADDIIGTLADSAEKQGVDCFILTGDRDSLQLVNNRVTVLLATNKGEIEYNENVFTAEYGFPPENIVDLKALMGDSSDNISGVKGIGEKTGLALIKAWKTVENLYENLEKAELTKSVLAKLEAGHEDAKTSKWLATICKDVPIERDVKLYKRRELDKKAVQELLSDLEMFSLLKTLHLLPVTPASQISLSAPEIVSENPEKPSIEFEEKALDKLALDNFKNNKTFFLYSEKKLDIICNGCYFSTEESAEIAEYFSLDCGKSTFGAKPAYKFCFANNIVLKNLVFDAEIAAYLLHSELSGYTIEKLCMSYNTSYQKATKCPEIACLIELSEAMQKQTREKGLDFLLYQVEQPLTEVLASMEHYGIKLDEKALQDFGEELQAELDNLEKKIYIAAGEEFNISSPKQLGVILFEKLGLKATKKTKTGYSTDAEVLQSLKHPIIPPLLEYRKLFKLNTTYVHGLLACQQKDGRIRTDFKQTETRTGRISSAEPNLQNIPVRTKIGANMRKFFVADEGKILVDADYNQIELRLLARLSGDENMTSAFNSGTDIHTETAANIFNLPCDMITPAMRNCAKAVNFGIMYGMGAFSLAKDIHVTVSQATQYINGYLARYPEVKEYMERTIAEAHKTKTVTTAFGRPRYIPELSATNKVMLASGERIARNTPIQGTAADVIKIAMIKVYNRLKTVENAYLILQIHDELIVECPPKVSEKVTAIIKEEMEAAAALVNEQLENGESVPFPVSCGTGRSWYDAK
jgi:DNA polymerase-1